MNLRSFRRQAVRWMFFALLGVFAALGFGVFPSDEAAFRSFDEAVVRWQHDPEFRTVATEYCVLGSRAMRTHPLGVATRRVIMALRSLPLLPKKYAVNPTSRAHYDDFTRGPLSSYLHLSGEQDISQYVGMFESIGAKATATEADLRSLLDAFHMDFPVAKDTGAVRSVAALLTDAGADKPLSIRKDIGPRLLPHIAALAAELGFDPDPQHMSPAQQQAVLERLDGFVRRRDHEIWRAKQLNDFCGGVWAQVYGPPYRSVMAPFVAIHDVCRVAVVACLLIWIGVALRSANRGARALGEDPSDGGSSRGPGAPFERTSASSVEPRRVTRGKSHLR